MADAPASDRLAGSTASNGPVTRAISPSGPSNGSPGPVIPATASCAANSAERAAADVAAPFHMDSSPTRVCRNGTDGTTWRAMALAMAAWSPPSSAAAAAATPAPTQMPWSQPRSRAARAGPAAAFITS
jgi:hypothetical protein